MNVPTCLGSPDPHLQLLAPETLLPEQVFDQFRRPLTPERHLMIAVVADGIECFKKEQMRRRRRNGGEAEQWLMSRDRTWPFSFENLCDALNIDSSVVRAALLRWREQQAPTHAAQLLAKPAA